jgi:hypothetical protein
MVSIRIEREEDRAYREWKVGIVLEEDGDSTTEVSEAQGLDVDAIDEDGALYGVVEARDELEDGALAGAIVANNDLR